MAEEVGEDGRVGGGEVEDGERGAVGGSRAELADAEADVGAEGVEGAGAVE